MGQNRLAQLRRELLKRGLSGFVVSSLPNIRYLSNFTGSNALLAVTRTGALFISDSRYAAQSRMEVRGIRRLITSLPLPEALERSNFLRRCREVGFETSAITYQQYRALKKHLRGISLHPVGGLVEDLALLKDNSELASILKAVNISDRVFHDLVGLIHPGVVERDLAAEISYLQRMHGAEQDAFEPIVASGPRGALPHARPGAKRIRSGEFVILDFGCVVDGYHSDLTRTVAVGKITRRNREVYDSVLDAQTAALAAARGGMWARDLDAVARRRIAARGFGKYFIHSLGHGLGLHVHERPRVSALSKDRLRAGSVITVEPGIYLPGIGGVRIEDDVLLEEDSCRILTRSPKTLMIV